jgi:hypothetical protein
MSPRLSRIFRGALQCRHACIDIQIQRFARETKDAARMRPDAGVAGSTIRSGLRLFPRKVPRITIVFVADKFHDLLTRSQVRGSLQRPWLHQDLRVLNSGFYLQMSQVRPPNSFG